MPFMPKKLETLTSAKGIFFSGGDQLRITHALRHDDGSNTKVLDALWTMYRRGGAMS